MASYHVITGAEPVEKIILELITTHLEGGEVPLVAARSSRFEMPFNVVKYAQLLVTNQRLIVAKDRLVGRSKPALSVPLADLASTGFGPLYGVGPTWEVHFHTTRGEPGIMYFDGPVEAEAFKNALHDAAVGSVRAEARAHVDDPVLEQRLQRLHNLIDDLRPLALPDALGRPFGDGCGLEQAMEAVFARLESIQDARECGLIMAVDLLANTTAQTPDQLQEVMGATPAALAQHQLDPESSRAVTSLGGAAQTFLAQFDGPGNIWDLWKAQDDVAVEFLCWHIVARLRLAATGGMPPVERP